ncbi:hypothetical protein D9M73_62610 [compost metagenome]
MFADGLRQLFEHAFGHGAFECTAHHTLAHGRIGGRASQHRVHVGNAQLLGDLAAQHAETSGQRASGSRKPGLRASQQTVSRALPDLLGCRASADHTLAQCASNHRAQLGGHGQAAARQHAAGAHGRQRFNH